MHGIVGYILCRCFLGHLPQMRTIDHVHCSKPFYPVVQKIDPFLEKIYADIINAAQKSTVRNFENVSMIFFAKIFTAQ